ncbi:hypothetical protein RPALISO_109 [Ruegeria phage RpAliso]|nr:hypothetical protein RPALISO_109 [Ruegeria phage RpAliso]
MGWNIAKLENTVSLSKEQADELSPKIVDLCPDHFYDGDSPFIEESLRDIETGKTIRTGRYVCHFNSDDLEHMDWLTYNDEVKALLASAGAAGRICFGSLEGDNSGEFWGVEFASGHYRPLTGAIHWTPGTSVAGN